MRIYLCGAMTGRKVKEVLAERRMAREYCKYYGYKFYDPADDEGLEKLDPEVIITHAAPRETMEWYVEKDESAVDHCDVLLNLTGDIHSDGGSWEMARAYYYTLIPIVIVAPRRARKELMGFTNIKVDGIFQTQGEAFEFLKEIAEVEDALHDSRETSQDNPVLPGNSQTGGLSA